MKKSYCRGEVANMQLLINLMFKIINRKLRIIYHQSLIPTVSMDPVKSLLVGSSCSEVAEVNCSICNHKKAGFRFKMLK